MLAAALVSLESGKRRALSAGATLWCVLRQWKRCGRQEGRRSLLLLGCLHVQVVEEIVDE